MYEIGRRAFLALLGGTAAGITPVLPAEQSEIPTIGFLSTRARDESMDLTSSFIKGLKSEGFIADGNMRIEYRWAEFRYERLRSLATELIGRQVSLIAAVGGAHSGLAAKATTSDISDRFCQRGRSHRVRPSEQPQ